MKKILFSILFISASVYSSESNEQAQEAALSDASLRALAGVVQACVSRCAEAGGKITSLHVNFSTRNILCECTKPEDDKQDVNSEPDSNGNAGRKTGCW